MLENLPSIPSLMMIVFGLILLAIVCGGVKKDE